MTTEPKQPESLPESDADSCSGAEQPKRTAKDRSEQEVGFASRRFAVTVCREVGFGTDFEIDHPTNTIRFLIVGFENEFGGNQIGGAAISKVLEFAELGCLDKFKDDVVRMLKKYIEPRIQIENSFE